MGERAKPARIPTVLAVALTAVACYLLGAAGAKTGLAQDGKAAQAGGPGPYQFTGQWNYNRQVMDAYLLDARTGAVYSAGYDEARKSFVWHPYVQPLPDKP
ncbi:MAG: hypothetical protein BGO49_19665 [Planctomycetales bacterium 71-10]|nr:MAG: hypothetical protein BGO49_19665 [Planctomycetales bacterium 71-10]